MWGGRSSRQRGREHRDSVITSTLPDTAAVRLMLDSYPPLPGLLYTPLAPYLTLSICLRLCRNLSSQVLYVRRWFRLDP